MNIKQAQLLFSPLLFIFFLHPFSVCFDKLTDAYHDSQGLLFLKPYVSGIKIHRMQSYTHFPVSSPTGQNGTSE